MMPARPAYATSCGPQRRIPRSALARIPAAATLRNGRPTVDEQPNNPLHGVTLAAMLEFLIEHRGWEAMARDVPIRCFTHEPSLTSSLKFLRKVPWARTKVEQLYLRCRRQQRD